MSDITHLEDESGNCQMIIRGVHCGREDVDVVFGENSRDVGEQARAIQCLDLDVNEEHAPLRGSPLDFDDSIRVLQQRTNV